MKWVSGILFPNPKDDKTYFIIKLNDSDKYRFRRWDSSVNKFYFCRDEVKCYTEPDEIECWSYINKAKQNDNLAAVFSSIQSILDEAVHMYDILAREYDYSNVEGLLGLTGLYDVFSAREKVNLALYGCFSE